MPEQTASGVARLSETEKIQRLVHAVRYSGLVFVRNGKDHDAGEAANHLELKLGRAGERVETARAFIEHIASHSAMTGEPYYIKLADGTSVLARTWFEEQLARLEGPAHVETKQAQTLTMAVSAHTNVAPVARQATIDQAISLVQRSDLVFVVPKRKGKRKRYRAPEFAKLLQDKTRWLGPDIREIEPWLDAIGSDAFFTFQPYRVVHPDGREQDFRSWLEARLQQPPGTLAAPP